MFKKLSHFIIKIAVSNQESIDREDQFNDGGINNERSV